MWQDRSITQHAITSQAILENRQTSPAIYGCSDMKRSIRKKRSKSSLQREADLLWSRLVRSRWPGCAVCGASQTEAHHLIPRSRRATRYAIDNGIALCATHHKWSTELSAHGAPLAFAFWFAYKFPHQHNWVMGHHRVIAPRVTVEWYRERIAALKSISNGGQK